MKLKLHVTLSGWCLAGLGAVGFLNQSDFYKSIGLSDNYVPYSYYMYACVSALFLINNILIIIKLINENVRVKEFFIKNRHLTSNICTELDINYIVKNSSKDSAYAADDDQTKRIFYLDKNSFTYVKNKTNEMKGYYCIIRLSNKGLKAIRDGIFSMNNLDEEYVNVKKDKYALAYIAGIYGGNSNIVNSFLLAELNGYIKAHRFKEIYARAETKNGLYWLEQYGFLPVTPGKSGLGHFYKITTKF